MLPQTEAEPVAVGLSIDSIQLRPVSQSEAGSANAARFDCELALTFVPSEALLEALDASVPLLFELSQRTPRGIDVQILRMSYAPLFERFELQQAQRVTPFRLRTELFDAFENLRGIPVAMDASALRLQLQIGRLPAALRLPAVLSSDWDFDSGWIDITRPERSLEQAGSEGGRGAPR